MLKNFEHFCLSVLNSMWVIRAGIHKILIRIAGKMLSSLFRPFWQADKCFILIYSVKAEKQIKAERQQPKTPEATPVKVGCIINILVSSRDLGTLLMALHMIFFK